MNNQGSANYIDTDDQQVKIVNHSMCRLFPSQITSAIVDFLLAKALDLSGATHGDRPFVRLGKPSQHMCCLIQPELMHFAFN